MEDLENAIATAISLQPRNKGKLTGQSHRCDPNISGRYGRSSRSRGRLRGLALLILRSTASLRGCDVVAIKVEDVAARG